jgi:hypothetical protein
MRCLYCNEEGHKIYDCNRGSELNTLLNKLTKPDFSKLTLKKLQRIASMNNIKLFLKKDRLISEIENLWNENARIRNLIFETDECCICLENIYNNNYSVISCGHKYHFKCIMDSIKKKPNCPICRIDIDIGSGVELDEVDFNFNVEDNIDRFNTFTLGNDVNDNTIRAVNRYNQYNNLEKFINYIGNVIRIARYIKNNPIIQFIGLVHFFYIVSNIYWVIVDDNYNFSYDLI